MAGRTRGSHKEEDEDIFTLIQDAIPMPCTIPIHTLKPTWTLDILPFVGYTLRIYGASPKKEGHPGSR